MPNGQNYGGDARSRAEQKKQDGDDREAVAVHLNRGHRVGLTDRVFRGTHHAGGRTYGEQDGGEQGKHPDQRRFPVFFPLDAALVFDVPGEFCRGAEPFNHVLIGLAVLERGIEGLLQIAQDLVLLRPRHGQRFFHLSDILFFRVHFSASFGRHCRMNVSTHTVYSFQKAISSERVSRPLSVSA